MSTRNIAVSTFWQIASQAAMSVLSILTAKFVAIGLSKELAGYYNSSYGYLQIFAILADFGLYAVSVREVSKAKDPEKVLGVFLVLRTIITVLSLGASILFVFLVPMWQGTPFPTGVAIASLVPFFTLLAGVIRTVFQVKYKMHFVFVAEVLQRILTTVGIGLFIYAGVRLTTDVRILYDFLWIGGLGAALLFVVSFAYGERLMKIRPHFDWAMLKYILVLAAPYGVSYLFITLYRQLDVAFIAFLRPDFAIQNAYYGFAGRVEDVAFLIPTFLLNSILPILSKRLADKEDVKDLLGKTFFLLLIVGSLFFVFSYFWAKPLTLLFATHAYLGNGLHAGTDTAFALMSIPMFLNGIVLFCFYIALAQHSWKQLMLTFGTGVAFTIYFNLLWTAKYGFVGAASALIIVHIILAVVLLPLTLKDTPIRFGWMQFFRWLLFTVILGSALYLSAPYLTSELTVLIGSVGAMGALVVVAIVTGLHKSIMQKT